MIFSSVFYLTVLTHLWRFSSGFKFEFSGSGLAMYFLKKIFYSFCCIYYFI